MTDEKIGINNVGPINIIPLDKEKDENIKNKDVYKEVR